MKEISFVMTSLALDGESEYQALCALDYPIVNSSSPTEFRAISENTEVWIDIGGTPALDYTVPANAGRPISNWLSGVRNWSDKTGTPVENRPSNPNVILVEVVADTIDFDDMGSTQIKRHAYLPTWREAYNPDDPRPAVNKDTEMTMGQWTNGMKDWMLQYWTIEQLIVIAGPSITTEEEMDTWATTHRLEAVTNQLTKRWNLLTS